MADQRRSRVVQGRLNRQRVNNAGRALAFVTMALCSCLAGCTRAELIKKITPPEDESYARNYVNLLRQQAFDQVQAALDPRIVDKDLPRTLAKMVGFFPVGEPKSVKVVNFSFNFRQVPRTDSLTLEYEFPDNQWVLVDLSIVKKGSAPTNAAFHVTQIPQSLEYTNRFTLAGKSFLQYCVLVLAVAAAIFSFYVFIVCVRTKPLKRKWLWAIFVLIGFGKIGVNWTTGELKTTPLAFNVPCAGAAAIPPYGPWIVSVYPPLGAIIFLTKRRDNLKPTELEPVEGELPSSSAPESTSPNTPQSST